MKEMYKIDPLLKWVWFENMEVSYIGWTIFEAMVVEIRLQVLDD
jgi:hypothetical protein